MHKDKIGQKIILGAFILIICFSWLLWILLEPYLDVTNYENRKMVEQPQLSSGNYGTFAIEYNNWFNDNIPFRNNLISLNSVIDYFLFEMSTSDRVVIGDNDWLFYNRVDDGDPIGCYMGTNILTEDELKTLAQNCLSQRDFLLNQGKEFVIYIVPNKGRIYSEYMPERYGDPAEVYRAKQIVEYLKANTDLRVVYPYEELMRAKEIIDYNLYYKTDTHWNKIGGYVGATALLKELTINMESLESGEITVLPNKNTSGDLARMLNLSKQLKSVDWEYYVEGYDAHNMQMVKNDFQTVISFSAEGADPRKIYVIRDSFASAMLTYIGSQFNESYMRHRGSYTYEDFLEQDPDIVVFEIAERYANELISFSIQ